MPEELSHTEKELFQRLSNDDEEAYTRLFHIYTPRLLPYIYKITGNEHLARELLQETFIRLWVKRADLKQVQLPDSWLFKVAANICLSYLRNQAARNQLQYKVEQKMPAASYPVLEQVEQKDMELLIHKAVQALPGKRKQVYLLSREEGLTHKQIADQLNISVNTVRNHISLALQSIQEMLQKETGLSIATLILLLAR